MMQENIGDDQLTVGALDRLTQRAAMVISRRGALKGTLGAVAASIGIRVLSPVNAAAACCRTYFGSCVNCHSETSGCSCNGSHCRSFFCDCGCGACGNFFVRGTVCDDGSFAVSCPGC
jgi:hypothetical protein